MTTMGNSRHPDCTRQPALYVLGLWWGDLATRSNKRQLAYGSLERSHHSFFESRYSDPVQEKMQHSLEQRMTIKFCVKLEKSAAETIPMLKKAFDVDCLSDRQIFRWHKAFAEGR
ncbi:hypothetical protein NQ318_013841 [Aromia moschata]|uniref:Mos1 transposase HTH domain-containing protein n=1 Tax=Aromia moschata TaxID=1265417 RepID=A0AAV8Z987_9CUCU|nr:hypothetical protein NQ318_013841 [Aromia moschata]